MFLADRPQPGGHPAPRAGACPRGAAVAVVALVGLALLAGGVSPWSRRWSPRPAQLIDNIPDFIQSLQRNETINDLVQRYDIVNKVQSAINASTVGNTLGGVLGGGRADLRHHLQRAHRAGADDLLHGRVRADQARARTGWCRQSRRERVSLLTDEILTKVGAYMVGALAIAVLAGVSTWVLVLILGLAYPFALAVVVAVLRPDPADRRDPGRGRGQPGRLRLLADRRASPARCSSSSTSRWRTT